MEHPAVMGNIQVCSISLNMTDRVRLIGVPMSMTSALRDAIEKGWGKAIQDERNYHDTHEFKVTTNLHLKRVNSTANVLIFSFQGIRGLARARKQSHPVASSATF